MTSRAPLRVRGEREYAVGPLALDEDVDATSPADLARSPAVRLFLERVRDVQPGFRLTSVERPHRDGDLPAARRTAARARAGSPVDQSADARRICSADSTQDVLLSTVGPRDLPERQQTINATVAWSYQLLAPHEQRVFRRLGALPGRFPIEAAAAVLSVVTFRRPRATTRSGQWLV